MTHDPIAAIRARCRELVAARRLVRTAVAWVCSELQADVMEEALLSRLRERWASGETQEGLRVLDAIAAREDAVVEAERARVVAAYTEHATERREARGGGEPVSVLTRASLWLAAVPGATSGQGRDPQIFKACGVASAFALPEDVAVDLVLREYAPRCKPVPTRGDVRGKVRRALSSGGDRYGAALVRR